MKMNNNTTPSAPAEIGAVITATVTRILAFGAFVKLADGSAGLVHISEVSDSFVNDLNDFLKVGQEVTVKLISRDETGKQNLSIKKAQPPKEKAVSAPAEFHQKPAPDGFEEMMKNYKKMSDDKLLDLKRSVDSKRGSSRKGKK